MFSKLKDYLNKPALYAPSTDKFWDDKHISKGMLAAHLTPDNDSATRNHDFVAKSVAWIAGTCEPAQYPNLLDLGCGPGIYAEQFLKAGYKVTGLDFSRRSIDYALKEAKRKKLNIKYEYEDYLELDRVEAFDLITLIWCDYGALAPDDRQVLLSNIYRALKPGGILIFDVFSSRKFIEKNEFKNYEYCPDGGFWYPHHHICLNALYKYEKHTIVNQTVIISPYEVKCYNIWEHYFTKEEIEQEIGRAGFKAIEIHADIAGGKYHKTSETLCLAVSK